MNNQNSFISFFKKPVMCKCGHPNKPCHRSGKWYDTSRSCKECDCNEFVSRNVDGKLNKGTEVGMLIGLGLLCGLIFFLYGSISYIESLDGKLLASQTIKIPLEVAVGYVKVGILAGGLFLGLFVFNCVCMYFKTHRKEKKPIDPKWSKEE